MTTNQNTDAEQKRDSDSFSRSPLPGVDEARERFRSASALISSGDYEKALVELLWFYHHALQIDPAFRGVRLSYALEEWRRLGELYPPAQVEMLRTRDLAADAVLSGQGSWDTFNDLSALNEYMRASQQTLRVFKQLHQQQPDLADRCASLVLHYLIHADELALAAIYLPDPVEAMKNSVRMMMMCIERRQIHPPPGPSEYDAVLYIYAEEVGDSLRLIERTQSATEAEHALASTMALVEPATLRADFEKALQETRAQASGSLVRSQ